MITATPADDCRRYHSRYHQQALKTVAARIKREPTQREEDADPISSTISSPDDHYRYPAFHEH